RDAEQLRETLEEAPIDVAQARTRSTAVEILDRIAVVAKKRRPRVRGGDRLEVTIRPCRIADADVLDRLMEFTSDLHRNRQPQQAVLRLDHVPVPPVAPRILRVVVENELVDAPHQIEVALPGNVG